MSKRIKRVFASHDQVLHLWANQSQADARCKNVFFDGVSCYSYGRHYELGRLIKYNGKTVALINDAGYSVTTNKHIHSAYDAVSHLIRIKTTDFSGTRAGMRSSLLNIQSKLVDGLTSHFSSRSFYSGHAWFDKDDGTVCWAGREIKEFNSTCRALGFSELTLDVSPSYIAAYDEHVQYCIEKKRLQNEARLTPEGIAKLEADRAKREALALRKSASEIATWRTGGQRTDAVRNLRPQILRVLTRVYDGGQIVQTSGGAKVPLEHAIRLLRLVEAGKCRNGERVGHFTVDSVGEGAVKIGCHLISINEARNVLGEFLTRLTLVPNVEQVTA